MEYYHSKEWRDYLNSSLNQILLMEKISYNNIRYSTLPQQKGIYIISEMLEGVELVLYIGRSKNLRNRIYTNHLHGSITNARLKKYIINDSTHICFENLAMSKKYIKEKCYVRWLFEDDFRKRGALEGYFTAMLFPKYGIAEEH